MQNVESKMSAVRITKHAIERYQARVNPKASQDDARLMLCRMVCMGHVRSTPRHWMRTAAKTPGLVFVYWSQMPGVCALVLNGALITVITRKTCQTRRDHLQLVATNEAPFGPSDDRRFRHPELPLEAA
jgi:hypothetical protein